MSIIRKSPRALLRAAALLLSLSASAAGAQSWKYQPSPNASLDFNRFLGAAAVSVTDVWAVGHYDASKGKLVSVRTLAERWDGTQWNVVPTPNAGSGWNSLEAVTALGASDVWAVGWATDRNYTPQTLTQRWDGAKWSIVASPTVPNGSELFAVSGASSTDVWAVGHRAARRTTPREPESNTFTIRWDGAKWNEVASPNGRNQFNVLRAVDAVAPNEVWAVGTARDASTRTTRGMWRTLAMRWDGAKWNVVPTPDGVGGGQLMAVTGTAPNDVWLSGITVDARGNSTPLFLRWDGAKLTTVPSPGGVQTFLGGRAALTAVAPDNVWAIGDTIARWNGTAWQLVPTASVPGASYGELVGGVAVSATDVWAVGSFREKRGSTRTLTHRFTTDTPVIPILDLVTVSPTSVEAGKTAQGKVKLTSPAPTGGAVVTLASNNAAAKVPATVTVPAGATSATFDVTTTDVTTATAATLTAAYNNTTRTGTLTVTPKPGPDTVTITTAAYSKGTRLLYVEAATTGKNPTLRLYNAATNAEIGKLVNFGGGVHAAAFRMSTVPANVTVKSSLGGSATLAVTQK